MIVLGTFPRFGAQCYSQTPTLKPFLLQIRTRLDGMFFALTGSAMAIIKSDGLLNAVIRTDEVEVRSHDKR